MYLKRFRIAIGFIFALAVLSVAALLTIDRYLPYQDTLQPADAVFVLDGEFPFRIWAALDLYHQGFVPLVVVPDQQDRQSVEKQITEKRGYGSVFYEQVSALQRTLPVSLSVSCPVDTKIPHKKYTLFSIMYANKASTELSW